MNPCIFLVATWIIFFCQKSSDVKLYLQLGKIFKGKYLILLKQKQKEKRGEKKKLSIYFLKNIFLGFQPECLPFKGRLPFGLICIC